MLGYQSNKRAFFVFFFLFFSLGFSLNDTTLQPQELIQVYQLFEVENIDFWDSKMVFLSVNFWVGLLVKFDWNTKKGNLLECRFPFSIRSCFHKSIIFAFFSPTPPTVKALIYITLLLRSSSGLPLFCSYIPPYSQNRGYVNWFLAFKSNSPTLEKVALS